MRAPARVHIQDSRSFEVKKTGPGEGKHQDDKNLLYNQRKYKMTSDRTKLTMSGII